MSISAYVGLPGSGKSYSVVKYQILPALAAGREVVTNLPLILPEVEKLNLAGTVTMFDLDVIAAEPARLFDYAKPGCIFVVDEAWKALPAGMQAVDIPGQWKELLTMHRHMVDVRGHSTQIVLCVQDLALLAPMPRKLVESTFVTTKLSFLGLSKAFRVDIFHGAVTGCTPNPKKALRQLGGRYTKDVYQLYKSHTMSESGSLGADEKKVDGRGNILKRPAFIIGAIVAPLLIGYSLHAFGKIFHSTTAARAGGGEPSRPAPPPQRSGGGGAGLPVAFAAPVPHVLMEITNADGSRSGILTDGDRIYRIEGDDCRRLPDGIQCLFKGSYYDAFGLVESATPRRPIAAYNSALVRR